MIMEFAGMYYDITNKDIYKILGLPKPERIFSIKCVDALAPDRNHNTLMFCNKKSECLHNILGTDNVILIDEDVYEEGSISSDTNDIIYVSNAKFKFCILQDELNLPSYFQLHHAADILHVGDNFRHDNNVILGGADFSPVLADDHVSLVQFPQLGGVLIGDDVTVKFNSMISKGTFGYTVVGDNTMIDYGCQIGHNCIIGSHCIIAAGTIIGGSTKIGDCTTIGIGAKIRNGITIGSHVSIGMGSVVTKDIPDNTVVVGNPARPITHAPIFSEKGLI